MTEQIIFFGSSDFSVPVLQKLLDQGIPVAAVVTTPDKPVGRHLTLTSNPVKTLAQQRNLPIIESLSQINDQMIKWSNNNILPFGLVAAYGRIIPPEILNNFNTHIYNIHPSLLPKYRGPSPLQQQILDGVTETGVTIIQLDEKMDHGPIIVQAKDKIAPDDTSQTLGKRLFNKGADLFMENLLKIKKIKLKPQDDSQATYTQKLTRQDGFVPYDQFSSQLTTLDSQLMTKFRAYAGWPGVWTIDPRGKRVKLTTTNPPLVQLEGRTPTPWPLSPVPGS